MQGVEATAFVDGLKDLIKQERVGEAVDRVIAVFDSLACILDFPALERILWRSKVSELHIDVALAMLEMTVDEKAQLCPAYQVLYNEVKEYLYRIEPQHAAFLLDNLEDPLFEPKQEPAPKGPNFQVSLEAIETACGELAFDISDVLELEMERDGGLLQTAATAIPGCEWREGRLCLDNIHNSAKGDESRWTVTAYYAFEGTTSSIVPGLADRLSGKLIVEFDGTGAYNIPRLTANLGSAEPVYDDGLQPWLDNYVAEHTAC